MYVCVRCACVVRCALCVVRCALCVCVYDHCVYVYVLRFAFCVLRSAFCVLQCVLRARTLTYSRCAAAAPGRRKFVR